MRSDLGNLFKALGRLEDAKVSVCVITGTDSAGMKEERAIALFKDIPKAKSVTGWRLRLSACGLITACEGSCGLRGLRLLYPAQILVVSTF